MHSLPVSGQSMDLMKDTHPLTASRVDIMNEARSRVAAIGVREDHTGEVPLQDLMQMSKDVYDLSHYDHILSTPPSGWTIDREYRQYPDDQVPQAGRLHVMAAVYTKASLAVMAFKGTNPATPDDDSIDIRSIFAGQPPAEPLVFAAQVLSIYQKDGYTVMTTGHSLGGYLAEVVSTTIGLAGAGFCAPGPGWHNGFKGGEGSGFRNINFRHDPVGNLLESPAYSHAQWPVYVTDYGLQPHHSYRFMLQSMKARGKSWTNQNALCKCLSKDSRGYYTYVSGLSGWTPVAEITGEARRGLTLIPPDTKSAASRAIVPVISLCMIGLFCYIRRYWKTLFSQGRRKSFEKPLMHS